MKKNIKLYSWIVLLLSLGLSGVAFADLPKACAKDSRAERFYDLGVLKGRSLVDQSYYKSVDLESSETLCDCFETFQDIVINAFEAAAPPQDSPLTVLCHYAGSYEGAIERVAELTVDLVDQTIDPSVDAGEQITQRSGFQCLLDCYVLGRFVGDVAATFYCDLSIALGGLALDEWLVGGRITFCSVLFEYGCHRMFDYLTPRYPSVEDPQCLPYTQSPYLEVYSQVRHNQCIYTAEE